MLQPVAIAAEQDDDRELTAAETTVLRSAIGGLMWTSLTRPDVLAELSTLQSVMNRAKVRHLRDVNSLVARAKRDKEAAIYYRPLNSNRYRIVCIHDASAATSTKNYAQEGVLIFLMADDIDVRSSQITASDEFAKTKLSGRAQLLHMQSNKAKRISYSTSHGETLAAINGLECSTLVSTRLAEITFGPKQPSLKQLLAIQEHGSEYFPVDSHTDCRDLFELSTGSRNLPQDKSQRLYVMAHREARATGRLRWFILTPTECMTADALTEVMTSPCLMKWLTTGCVAFWNAGHSIELRRLPPAGNDLTEEDLIAGDSVLSKKTAWFLLLPALQPRSLALAATMAIFATPATAQPINEHDISRYDIILLIIVVMISIMSLNHFSGISSVPGQMVDEKR